MGWGNWSSFERRWVSRSGDERERGSRRTIGLDWNDQNGTGKAFLCTADRGKQKIWGEANERRNWWKENTQALMGSEEENIGMATTWPVIWRISAVIVLLGTISAAFMLLPVEQMLQDFLIWVQKDLGPWGPVILALAYIPCTVFAIPASILTLGGGYLFGLVIGFAADSIGSTGGAVAAFLVGRTVGRSYVTSKLKDFPQFQAIAIAIERQGFKIVLLLRMVPLLPYNVLNYLLSVTPISVWTYTLASWIGMMPLTLVFVYVGTTIKDITDIDHGGHFTPARWTMIGVGLATSVVVIILVTRIARDALQRAVEEADVRVDEIIVASDPIEVADQLGELRQPLVVKV